MSTLRPGTSPQEATMAFDADATGAPAAPAEVPPESVFELSDLQVHYGDFRAVREVSMSLRRRPPGDP